MNLMMIGTGYVGIVTGVCFAEMGNRVTCVDIDDRKIEQLNSGLVPIYEPGLEDLMKKNLYSGNLVYTTSMDESLDHSDVVFIAVGTPMWEDGSADLSYVLNAATEIGKKITKRVIVVNKSTVPVGTADKVRDVIKNELKHRGLEIEIDVISNPEFLKEGNAINDFMKPDRVIIGASQQNTISIMEELYAPFMKNYENFIIMDVRSAEMTKYAANAMLATKISFMNEISNICERVGANVNMVRIGIGSDSRIGFSFIYPGCGYGGSCFPKDVQALIRTSQEYGYDAELLKSVEEINQHQKEVILQKIIRRYGSDLRRRKFAIWGLSFKPETDDMREASSITIIKGLVQLGAEVNCYDPKAMMVAEDYYFKGLNCVNYFSNKYDALNEANAMILVTEWKEFRAPDFYEILQRLKEPVIFDGRNQYKADRLLDLGFEYHQIGVASSSLPPYLGGNQQLERQVIHQ